jgi:hypothetical protein
MSEICVIGAGAAGIAAARALTVAGLRFDWYEQAPDLGGIWRDGVYDSVHLISSRNTSGYPDAPMPTFTSGVRAPVDTIVWATGFTVAFPFLDADRLPWRHGIPLRVAAGMRAGCEYGRDCRRRLGERERCTGRPVSARADWGGLPRYTLSHSLRETPAWRRTRDSSSRLMSRPCGFGMVTTTSPRTMNWCRPPE